MKKTILCIAGALLLIVVIISCSYTEVDSIQNDSSSMFVKIETTANWQVVYHKQTKVMYAVSNGIDNGGNFTILVNPDGTPMLYQD